VVLPLIDESVVPVASKNANSGEIPTSRTTLAFSVNAPLVPVQDNAAGGVTGGVTGGGVTGGGVTGGGVTGGGVTGGGVTGAPTVTVADWLVLPPAPVQASV
jgi:hypothetical protein